MDKQGHNVHSSEAVEDRKAIYALRNQIENFRYSAIVRGNRRIYSEFFSQINKDKLSIGAKHWKHLDKKYFSILF